MPEARRQTASGGDCGMSTTYPTTLAPSATDHQGTAPGASVCRSPFWSILSSPSERSRSTWQRVAVGLERGQRFIMGFLQADFTSRWNDIYRG